MTLGDVLDGTFAAIHRNRRAVLGVSALIATTGQLLTLGVQAASGNLTGQTVTVEEDDSLSFTFGAATVVGPLVSAVLGLVFAGMIAVVLAEDLAGRRTTAREMWQRVRPRFWALLAAALLAGLLPFLGLVLLVVPGAMLWGTLALTTPALVLEGTGPLRALKRSWRLVMPAFARVWSIRALAVVLGFVIEVVIVLPFGVLATVVVDALGDSEASQLPVYAVAIATVGAIIAGTLLEPFYAGVVALLYLDRRMRAEGADIALSLASRPDPAPLPGGHR